MSRSSMHPTREIGRYKIPGVGHPGALSFAFIEILDVEESLKFASQWVNDFRNLRLGLLQVG